MCPILLSDYFEQILSLNLRFRNGESICPKRAIPGHLSASPRSNAPSPDERKGGVRPERGLTKRRP